ncbi:hypothetical protein PVAND_009476 [Polypedilum vanderplanki]|uniref:Uncharacterized protein n=1 Tax=Polypedilum vanderplanki TaxID=319348 RepID=A0A9J6CDD8_POLVA|nr:hypothetical protein PVAND_009476 [Polypedilum vanderplanki]
MEKGLSKLEDGVLRFDGLKNFLIQHEYKMEIGIYEDGTKLVEDVHFDINSNTLIGLTAEFDVSTGLPIPRFHRADTAFAIYNSITTYEKSSYAQIIIAQPYDKDSKSYILGVYSTNNKFTHTIVTTRLKFIKTELQKRGINIISFGSDGDNRFLRTQKGLVKYGQINYFGPFSLCGDINSECFGIQDFLHLTKKLKNLLYDLVREMMMGQYKITVNHLILLIKKFPKTQHRLNASDLDTTDRMNYDCISKITNSHVIELLQHIEGSNGTIIYLQLIKKYLEAFVEKSTKETDRLFNVIYVSHFIRIWKTYLLNNRKPMSEFITSNCFEGLELNCLWLDLKNLLTFDKLEKPNDSFDEQEITEEDIVNTIHNAMIEATERARALGMEVEEVNLNRLVHVIDDSTSEKNKNDQIQSSPSTAQNDDIENEDDEIDQNMILQDVEFLPDHSDDAYLYILNNGERKKIKKRQLIWMLLNEKIHINADVRQRFVPRRSIFINPILQSDAAVWQNDAITKGDYIALRHNTDIFVLGRVLNFKYTNFRTKKSEIYYGDMMKLSSANDNLAVQLDPLYLIKNWKKEPSNSYEYFLLKNYIFHSSSDIDFNNDIIRNEIIKYV